MSQKSHVRTYLQSRDHAQAVIHSAKELRNSKDNFVRKNVFINPNLTKAEANAQFEPCDFLHYLTTINLEAFQRISVTKVTCTDNFTF